MTPSIDITTYDYAAHPTMVAGTWAGISDITGYYVKVFSVTDAEYQQPTTSSTYPLQPGGTWYGGVAWTGWKVAKLYDPSDVLVAATPLFGSLPGMRATAVDSGPATATTGPVTTTPVRVRTVTTASGFTAPGFSFVAPPDVGIVPSLRPTFQLGFQVPGGTNLTSAQVTIEIARLPDFATVLWHKELTIDTRSGANLIRVPYDAVDALVDDWPYHWRASLTTDVGLPTENTSGYSSWSFTTSVAESSAVTVDISRDVAGTVSDPHVWFVYPPYAKPGDVVTLYGQGFTLHPIVHIGSGILTASTSLVPAQTGSAIIDPNPKWQAGVFKPLVTVEHYQTTVTLPPSDDDVWQDGKGASLWIEV